MMTLVGSFWICRVVVEEAGRRPVITIEVELFQKKCSTNAPYREHRVVSNIPRSSRIGGKDGRHGAPRLIFLEELFEVRAMSVFFPFSFRDSSSWRRGEKKRRH